jgi:uncharacterized membrane protein
LATETDIEDRISRLLWYGVAAAGALVLLGMLLYSISPPGSEAYSRGDTAILAGVALLLLTPTAMVAMLFLHYLRLRDLDFMLITLFILAMMILGYVFGAA